MSKIYVFKQDINLIFLQYKISKPERESESESEDEEDTFGPSTARKDNVNWTDVKDVTRESWKDICWCFMLLFWHRG